jgi:hypothetical protein
MCFDDSLPFPGDVENPMALPRRSANRVENTGMQRKQNCCKLLQVYVLVFCWLYPLKP